MLHVLKAILKSEDLGEDLIEGAMTVAEVVLGFQKEKRKRRKHLRDVALIDRAWKGVEDGAIEEFEIGDVRIVATKVDTAPDETKDRDTEEDDDDDACHDS